MNCISPTAPAPSLPSVVSISCTLNLSTSHCSSPPPSRDINKSFRYFASPVTPATVRVLCWVAPPVVGQREDWLVSLVKPGLPSTPTRDRRNNNNIRENIEMSTSVSRGTSEEDPPNKTREFKLENLDLIKTIGTGNV